MISCDLMIMNIQKAENMPTPEESLASEIFEDLKNKYGFLMSGNDVAKQLGFKSTEAFRQAICRNKLSIPVFTIPYRKGKFAYSKDVAQWLASLHRQKKSDEKSN